MFDGSVRHRCLHRVYEIVEIRGRGGLHLVANKGSSSRHFYSDASLIEHANIEYKAKYDLGNK